jgi:hypothetical protein
MKHAEEPGKRARSMLARNTLEVHVAAQSAMRESEIRKGNSPGIKSRIATSATPRPQQRPDKAILFLPWEALEKAYVKADSQGKFHLRRVDSTCTIIYSV